MSHLVQIHGGKSVVVEDGEVPANAGDSREINGGEVVVVLNVHVTTNKVNAAKRQRGHRR